MTRDEAIEKGLSRYFTGASCVRCGSRERYIANSRCVPCAREARRKYYDRLLKKPKRARVWDSREARRRYKKLNPDKVAAWNRSYLSKRQAAFTALSELGIVVE